MKYCTISSYVKRKEKEFFFKLTDILQNDPNIAHVVANSLMNLKLILSYKNLVKS